MNKIHISLSHSIQLIIVGALTCLFLFIPLDAFAQAGGLVPCDGPDCNACELIVLGNNVMAYVVGLSIILAALGITYGGFLYVTAAGSMEQVKRGHQAFKSVLIGFVFVLAAWIIIATISDALLRSDDFRPQDGSKWLPWNPINNCQDTSSGGDTGETTGPQDPPEDPVPGCMDPNAENYNDEATADDDSCTYVNPTTPVRGCTDENAPNYDPNATQDDDSCEEPAPPQGTLGDGVCGPVPANEFDVRAQVLTSEIKINDTPACREDNISRCSTYLGDLNQSQIRGLRTLQEDCNCSFFISGAAETRCHSTGSRHYSGAAVDIRPNPGIDSYMTSKLNFSTTGRWPTADNPRAIGASKVLDERSGRQPHWHIEF